MWLGNDETHYVRRWEEKDLSDLKRLISMTVSWIDLVMDSEATRNRCRKAGHDVLILPEVL